MEAEPAITILGKNEFTAIVCFSLFIDTLHKLLYLMYILDNIFHNDND